MCDYSLMSLKNRLAMEGDCLMAHRFRSGTVGLVGSADFQTWKAGRPMRLWARIKDCFAADREPAPVVCVPPGAGLRLDGVPEWLREQYHLCETEEATFTQLSADANRHRDGLRFSNGSTMLLQLLPEGQRITVLSCSLADEIDSPLEHGEQLLANLG